jgi:FixJ family two-component response regulator
VRFAHSVEGLTLLSQVPVISIIDDDLSVRVAIERLVRSLGYVAQTFSSASEFLRCSSSNGTSCIITDVQLPGMSGVELQDHLACQRQTLPIIFITAFPEESIRSRAMTAGAVCFLTKPFDGKKLVQCIEAALSDRRPHLQAT